MYICKVWLWYFNLKGHHTWFVFVERILNEYWYGGESGAQLSVSCSLINIKIGANLSTTDTA